MSNWKLDLKKLLSTKAWKIRKLICILMILLGVMLCSVKFYVEKLVEQMQTNELQSKLLDTGGLEKLTKDSAKKEPIF